MLVICEDCAKKYNIDETRIKGKRAKFSCKECGHIIVVDKPRSAGTSSVTKSTSDEKDMTNVAAAVESPEEERQTEMSDTTAAAPRKKASASRAKGMPLGAYLLLTLITGFLMVGGAFGYLYFKYIPEIINSQIELRTAAITESFSGVIQKPLLLRNYLQVNKEAQRASKLPGVAYAAVINKRGVVIAGFFSDLGRFDKQFELQVKEKGLPVEVFAQNKLPSGAERANSRITVGGKTIYDEVASIPDSGGEVHVGIYVSEVDDAIREALISPLTLSILGVILFIGFIVFFLLTRTITKPMQELTNVANRISLGEMDLIVKSSGPREMRELASAFERMRHSIKGAMERLSK
ncbi:MAG: zinc-ribbon domain-containing protein [Proteobacteria bacterium]|nr:zinc-ribbon domain-containing protein [Pseudomonadota bacterium]MBU1419641.1 zinc-ribbon domain-containing protein [Pseudomonadota bacterium]MBU1453432.1 zinc-ribbon domain-containing protein [Pseudomonadota bacterium]